MHVSQWGCALQRTFRRRILGRATSSPRLLPSPLAPAVEKTLKSQSPTRCLTLFCDCPNPQASRHEHANSCGTLCKSTMYCTVHTYLPYKMLGFNLSAGWCSSFEAVMWNRSASPARCRHRLKANTEVRTWELRNCYIFLLPLLVLPSLCSSCCLVKRGSRLSGEVARSRGL
jgi:hypothetical protein